MTKYQDPATLCMALMRADTASEVQTILEKAGYWDDLTAWRPFNDDEGNYATIGNQQGEGIAALVEKIINSVDARLVNACMAAGVNPESAQAPQSMTEAVARFFDGGSKKGSGAGRVAEWQDTEATKQGKLLTVTATGHMAKEGNFSISIADAGEGQTPDRVPDTFMSLQRSNKLRIPFVQGKFNMGGTGALPFSGNGSGLQLVVTRRNPGLLTDGATARDSQWSFTLVRRQDPVNGARNSMYTYLAPVGATSGARGEVLSFAAPSWPIFPEADDKTRDAYARHSTYGSLVKLYEYEWRGSSSNIVMTGNGLLRRIDVGLPELALPVRLYECRPGYKGDSQSFSTNALGIVARLDRDKAKNLDGGAPIGAGLTVDGKQIPVRIYVFQPKRGEQYKSAAQGVIWSVNGQTHAMHPVDFFRRKSVGLGYLADSLLVVVDCSAIEGRMREDIFMNSRDRLRDKKIARELEHALEQLLRSDPTLRELANKRRENALKDKLLDDKPLAAVLQGLLKANPLLSKLLFSGLQLAAPFPPLSAAVGDTKAGAKNFVGQRYPTFFRLRGHGDSEEAIVRQVNLNARPRFTFETDAADDYFSRIDEPGALNVTLPEVPEEALVDLSWSWNGPRSGLLHLSLDLPDGLSVGDALEVEVQVVDPVRTDAFITKLRLVILPPAVPGPGGGNPNPPKVANKSEDGQSKTNQLALPNVIEVEEKDWHTRSFTAESALSVISSSEGGADSHESHDFYVNVDNKYLKILQKESKEDPRLLAKQFIYGFVILGLAILQDVARHPNDATGSPRDAGAEIQEVSRAVAPVLVPMLHSIGDLSEEDLG